ncbi:multipass membrane protein [Candidatus Mancarchaeum acidiphilum]|uniref:Multipass membrane protein n=1 Tax=Candidatus Mancarchaeum acidiphilum TaxID=1920749 RepID=A0A218NP54_9ARCH|nr:hypothetical protein [Candidatus Mancarchaeum acidiphilum]ASI14257.1 multipass membrane protein [Candidatus Mancarchaeum acidiphilum]
MDGQIKDSSTGMQASKIGMISGLSFVVMIIFGAIVGDIVFYTFLNSILFYFVGPSSIFLTLVIGIVIVIISASFISQSNEPSGLLYAAIFLGCMGVPLFGGVEIYRVAKKHNLTR